MTWRCAVTAFLTGLYFALLQFSYLMLLQINVSSAYISYLAVTIAWMMGAIGGLWLEDLSPRGGIALGIGGYYAAALLTARQPFSTLTLTLTAIATAVSGLWGGRFFVSMLNWTKRSDRLFFHENNGFVLGITVFLLGFTLLGRPFLLWTPGLLAGLLLALAPRR